MVPIIVAEMVEKERYGAYNGIVSLAIAISFILGPILGGAITDGTTWRWIFWINIPVGFVGLVLVFVAMPAEFPHQSSREPSDSFGLVKRGISLRGKVDYPGFFLLLAASVLLIVAIEEAGTSFAWSSSLVIALLVIAGVLLVAFVAWEWNIDHRGSQREPVFPWSFFKKRVLMGMYL